MSIQKLRMLYVTIPRDVPKSKIDAPRIFFNTTTISWSGKKRFAEINLVSVKKGILELTKTLLSEQQPDTVVVLGWKFETDKKKQLNIEINNTVCFSAISQLNTSFIRIPDMFQAKKSPKRTILKIFQKISPGIAMDILNGTYVEIDPDENVIVIS